MPKTKVKVEIYHSRAMDDCSAFEGRLLGYINEADLEAILSSEKARKSMFSGRTVPLADLNAAGSTILDKRLLFTIKDIEKTPVFNKHLFVTSPIKNKLSYTEKESSTMEFMSLETEADEWISIVEEDD